MNFRLAITFIGLFFVSCVYLPTQRSPLSEATSQFELHKTTGTEIAETIRPSFDSFDTFNNHRYSVYQWTGEGIYVLALGCGSPIQKGKSPLHQFMLVELDDKDLLVRFQIVRKYVSSEYFWPPDRRVAYNKELVSETWSISSATLTADVTPYQLYLQDIHHPDAKRWLCEAADQHNPEALYRLGVLYEKGIEGRPKNIEMAYFWYRLGAEVEAPWWLKTPAPRTKRHWSDQAAKRIEGELTPEQRTNLDDKIKTWRPGECNELIVPDNSPH
jgi:hypothetical protein